MLSATPLIGLFLIFKFLIFTTVESEATLPFHLLGLNGLIGVMAIFLEFNDSMGPCTERL